MPLCQDQPPQRSDNHLHVGIFKYLYLTIIRETVDLAPEYTK